MTTVFDFTRASFALVGPLLVSSELDCLVVVGILAFVCALVVGLEGLVVAGVLTLVGPLWVVLVGLVR